MRLRQRKKVDLPQPEGPMIAVTRRSPKAKLTSLTACCSPKYAFRPSTVSSGLASTWDSVSAAVAAAIAARATPGSMESLIDGGAEAGAGCKAGGEADDKDD